MARDLLFVVGAAACFCGLWTLAPWLAMTLAGAGLMASAAWGHLYGGSK